MKMSKKWCKNVAKYLVIIWYFALGISQGAFADVITQWNQTSLTVVTNVKMSPGHANRAIALVHTAIYEACNAITQRYVESEFAIKAHPQASIEAAVASASHQMLLAIVPQQADVINQAYQEALGKLSNGAAKQDGILVGQSAAKSVLQNREGDVDAYPDTYRPITSAGIYVPTTLPAASFWSKRIPWLLTSVSQFRAAPPPQLESVDWARDFNEVKRLGRVDSQSRTAEQTKVAKFWQATLPPIYHGIIDSVVSMPNRDITQNARFFAASTRAIDDALIAVFEAKYYYHFWRPITAIRNADIDNNPDTSLDPSWQPYIPTPMHPEYPCAHCVVASTLGNVIKAELGNIPTPILSTQSSTANNEQRSWDNIDEFMQEVSSARIYDGVHYRFSTEAGVKMGEEIARLAVRTYYQ
ncbi:vanadium-dependent haloperoxidase [Paraglaciecola marina]|uniref:vanadium-dependent haloperoxidase n=1 Tax=Paraglaciecola marina TaxID=2500157 RepID=UPI0019821687|nr:vanadium-dependent haloperoxidase [Paraglaciecola marina]